LLDDDASDERTIIMVNGDDDGIKGEPRKAHNNLDPPRHAGLGLHAPASANLLDCTAGAGGALCVTLD